MKRKLAYTFAIILAALMSPFIIAGFLLGIVKAYFVSGLAFAEMFEEYVGDIIGDDE